jgi:hypothetical protein
VTVSYGGMTRAITHQETPEERELARKRARLAALESELGQRELDLHTLLARLRRFEARYLQAVGWRLAERDRLSAEIAALRARAAPGDDSLQEEARRAAEQARASAEAAGAAEHETPPAARLVPSEELKRLYREAARRIHPDLAADDAERERRTRVMAALNRAFEEGDEARVREIFEEWDVSPEAVTGDGVGAELVRVIRKIDQAERRLEAIAREMADLEASDLFRLMLAIEQEEAEGGDPLGRMAASLDAEVEEARETLRRLQEERER